ncbi:MAG: type II toxin-antitoxin system RelE/ParE family toxin, partial [Gemmatimonadaceae bacterium]
TEGLAAGGRSRRFVNIEASARRKLRMMHAATRLDDLKAVPGNRLEPLSGDRKGEFSVRINDQWRICFAWKDGDAYAVEIVEHH